MTASRVKVRWTLPGKDDLLQMTRVLYAYLWHVPSHADPERFEVLYLGKAWEDSVRQRFDSNRRRLGSALRARGFHSVVVLVGSPECVGGRLTSSLLRDAESLLISRLVPVFNGAGRLCYAGRKGLEVLCSGRHWPAHHGRRFAAE
jgi:hypothetical protein